jgi:polar amino acid transport system substrate-binding protein
MIRLLLLLFFCLNSSLFAEGEPLNVGIESFSPPFVMQGAHHEIFGFDIDMMNSLCKIIHKTCTFRVMRFDQLLTAVANRQIDAAVSSITITPARSKIVNFSMPYLLSYSRFLQKQSAPNTPFSLELLKGKKIGIEAGTIFLQELDSLGVKNSTIKEYSNVNEQLVALGKDEVDFILLDNATAIYWASNSSKTFRLIGPSLMYGYGYGIAINLNDQSLLNELNNALVQYQSSNEYKQNYNKYFAGYLEK